MNNFNLNENGKFPRMGSYVVESHMCGKDKIAVDLGSNAGAFELKYYDKFKNIYYFEASYNNFLESMNNIHDLDNDIKNCYGFNLAISNKTGKLVKIYASSSNDRGSNTIIRESAEFELDNSSKHIDKENYHLIPTISIKDIFKLIGVTKIDYMKIDIEGAEYESMINTDLSAIDYICMEIHNMLGATKIQKLKEKILKTHKLEKTITTASPNQRNEESLWASKQIL
jgi:FkbM family methyltransferase